MNLSLENYLEDFCQSPYFSLIHPSLTPHADQILHHFCSLMANNKNEDNISTVLETFLLTDVPKLSLKTSQKQMIPELLESFFNYLSDSGTMPAATNWNIDCSRIAPLFKSRLKPDGTLKGETFKKKYSDVSRNDPCPCGSGLKFKKCCMKLLGG